MSALRRFNASGIEAFRGRLRAIQTLPHISVDDLLENENLTEVVHGDVMVDVVPLESRREAAETMNGLLEAAGVRETEAIHDVGLWAWLAAAWLDQLAPANGEGFRVVRAHHRWIPQVQDYKTYYRHLLLGPYRIYRLYRHDPELAMALLATRVEAPGEIVEQLASKLDYVTNPSVIGLATDLYYDPGSRSFKIGAAGKGPGSVRRLTEVLAQFDLTWDFRETTSERLKELLPGEFDRFR